MAVMMEEERPVCKTLLPVRINSCVMRGQPAQEFVYEIRIPNIGGVGGYKSIPMRKVIQDGFDLAILECFKEFWLMEARLDGLMKERDDAVADAQKARHEKKVGEQQIGELQRRVKKAEDRAKKAEDRIME